MEAEDLRGELEARGVTVHHKTGVDKLRSKLEEVLTGESTNGEEVQAEEPVTEKKVTKTKLTPEQDALRLIRVIVSPNDPLLATYPGLIFTVGSSIVNKGKMIKKYVPFNNDEGWHVPNIIYQQIENAQMQKFKTVKMPNGERVLQPYITKKFNVEVLPPLTEEELSKLASAQKARGDA